uniref:Uncharacterized protein n=1 Tax=Tetranychus urticae TaxID=32264 RepID=T1JZZ2_TETUR
MLEPVKLEPDWMNENQTMVLMVKLPVKNFTQRFSK